MDFGVLLNVAGIVFVDELNGHMAAAGFDGFTFRTGWVIRVVGKDTVPLRELAERMGLSSPGTLKAIDPMIGHGYVERAATEDRRVRAVRVTERGWQALATAREFHEIFESELGDRVGEQTVQAIRIGLTELLDRGPVRMPGGLVSPAP